MKFEFDPSKSEANLEKHGIDFETAQALWIDPLMLTAPARTDEELRCLTTGRIGGDYWSMVWTPRRGSIRIISVRRARKEEVDQYEGQ